MNCRPILFSGGMVRAILADQKTVTRRLVKLPPSYEAGEVGHAERCGDGWALHCDPGPSILLRCPYGQPGDRLWVRETWRGLDGWRPENGHLIEYRADRGKEWREAPEDVLSYQFKGEKWRSSIFLPRWACRLTLEVTSIGVERLQAITEDGARAEGVESEDVMEPRAHRSAFRDLWDVINGERASWESNPWVWVVGFKRVAP